jgi:hypothetical protein
MNETVTDSSDDVEDEEPPKEVVTLEAKPTADKAKPPNKSATVPAKPEAVPPNEPTSGRNGRDTNGSYDM